MPDAIVRLTPLGLEQAELLQSTVEEYKDKPIRLYLDGKGCDGFFYGVTFDQVRKKDHIINQGPIKIVIDSETLQFVDGATIDWVDDDRGKGFLVDNPNHKKFRGKFFKRKNWQERLAD